MPDSNEMNLEIELFELPSIKKSIQSIGLYKDNVKASNPLSSIKSNGSIISVLASLYAKENQFDDAFIMNSMGHICESISSNVFWIKGMSIYTPPISEGCVAGVMRQHLINILKGEEIWVIEKPLTNNELMDADEVFLTNSIHQMVSVLNYAGKKYTCNRTDEIRNNFII